MKRPIDRWGVPRYSLINPFQGHIITNLPILILDYLVLWVFFFSDDSEFLSVLIRRDTG